MPALSVVIPTHQRPEILETCLEYLEKQTVVADIEVIVVHDGPGEVPSSQPSPSIKLNMSKATAGRQERKIPKLTFLEIPKSHQGVARNRGVEKATSPFILFIGDDIFLAPDACEKHLSSLKANSTKPQAILGFTTWDPALTITPLMRWLETSGWQFGYPMIEQYANKALPPEIQHRFTYTSHISVPADIAKKFPFREDVSLYGWEDIEWGLRLKNAGVQLLYEPDAKALHHHPITLEQSLKRMETLGASAVKIEKLAPELHVVPKGFKRTAYQLASLLPTLAGEHRRAFLRGIAH